MASQCVVATCTWPENEADWERPSLHRFPWKQPQLARKWVANVIMSGTPAGKITHSSRVCSLHFEKGLRTSECIPTYFKGSKTTVGKTKPKLRKKKSKSKKTSQQGENAENSRGEDKRPVLSKQVVKNGFEKKFISQMTDFWKFKLFCDLKLVIGGIEVMAHQLVFNVAQPFCLQGLRTHKGENSVLTVEVPVVTSKEAVESFMTYLYEGTLLITETTVYEILSLGTYFKFSSIEYFCNSFIKALSTYQKASVAQSSKSGPAPSIKELKRYHSKKRPSETVTMPKLMKESAGQDYSETEKDVTESPILSNFKIEIDVDEKDPVQEGVDETDMYTPCDEEDVSMETNDKPMRITCVDDNDQEWLLVPNETKDTSDAEKEFDDIDPEVDDADIPDIPNIKQEKNECEDDDVHHEMSPAKPSHEENQLTKDSDADESGSLELGFDASKDIKPILLPDGSILETHLSKDNISPPMDEVNDKTIQRVGSSSLAEDHEDHTVLGSNNEIQRKPSPETSSQDAFDLSSYSDHPIDESFEDKEIPNEEIMNNGEKVKPVSSMKEGPTVLMYEESDIGWESWESHVEPTVDFGVDEDGNQVPDYEEFKHNNIYFKYYKCDRCPSLFTSRVQRQEHVQVVHFGFRYVCQYCGKKMTSPNGLRAHELEHTSEQQQYQCKKCNKTFHRKAALDIHVERHQFREVISAAKEEKRHNCRLCLASFASVKTLMKHKSTMHKTKLPTPASHSPAKVSPVCPECDLTFKCVSSMRRHFKIEHPDSELPSSAQFNWRDVIQAKSFGEKDGQGYELSCVKEAVRNSMEQVHKEVLEVSPKPKRRRLKIADHVTGTKNFHCQECGMDFLFAASLRRHCKSEHSNT